MEAQDLLPHRTALIGAAVALTIGLAGGLILKTGSQTAPEAYSDFAPQTRLEQVEQIAWPTGKLPDYVVGTDFLKAQQPYQPPVVLASYEVPDYTPARWEEPTPAPAPAMVQKVAMVEPEERSWPSTGGDILDIRLPEDAPRAPEAPEAPVVAAAPVALAAASY
jgi:hypothetical protein